MDPNQRIEEQPVAPTPQLAEKRRKKLLKWGLVCLIGPTVLFIAAVFIAAVSNFVFSGSTSSIGDPATSGEIVRTILNVLVFLMGAITILTWLPGIIIGVILLVKRQG